MIIFIHIIYRTLRDVCEFLKYKMNNNHHKTINSNLILESEVILNTKDDFEFVLKFDPPMYCQRYSAVHEIIINENWRGQIKKIVDFGCAEFGFFVYVKHVIGLNEILFVDIDINMLKYHISKLYPLASDYLGPRKEPLCIKVLNGSIAYPSPHLTDVDAVICIEIIEHLYPDTLDALPYNIFGFIQPRIAIFTTPNADFNVLFNNFCGVRHYDHKFEWTKIQFQDWAENIVARYPNYSVTIEGIGPGPIGTEYLGRCSQMAVFIRQEESEENKKEDWQTYFDNYDQNIIEVADQNKARETNVYNCKFCKFEQISNHYFLSYGVCTYETCSLQIQEDYLDPSTCVTQCTWSLNCDHSKLFYTELDSLEYPYEIDLRTQEEIILQSIEYGIHKCGVWSGRYFNEELDRSEIPLYELTYMQDSSSITITDVRNVLQAAGWEIEECYVEGNLTLCVIFQPNLGMSSSSHRTQSASDNSEVNYVSENNWDNTSQWDAESPKDDRLDITNEIAGSAEVNNVSGSQWDADSPKDDKLDINNENPVSPDVWIVNSDSYQFNDLEKSDDMCGETSAVKPLTQLECLFDSGCQISTSSIEISRDILFDVPVENIEKESETFVLRSESEGLKSARTVSKKQKAVKSVNLPPVMKSDGNIIKSQKCNARNAIVHDVPELPVEPVIPPNPEIVIENGDLANNNRDGEGNNYQAQENHVVMNENDNAVPRIANLDEDNENHIVLGANDEQQENEDIIEENLEDASCEVLFDPNSEFSLPEIEFTPGEQERNNVYIPVIGARVPLHNSAENIVINHNAFPGWLLHLLNNSEEGSVDTDSSEAHFYSQGDGLGIHPSVANISTDTTSSDESVNSSTTIVIQGVPVTMPSTSTNEHSENSEYHSIDEGNHSDLNEQNESILDEQSLMTDFEDQAPPQAKD